ncbi:hypothetical protein NDU88_002449 [Pleurodeles waltl]|uniref:Uncharacterized protein n=1 Tax=Pleurodeles waltl TaxID=8319 RepID=A0AAV7KS67_PLEWA|nr:hypothetical protein NDU88_002449 [Pleurodeles waltl]
MESRVGSPRGGEYGLKRPSSPRNTAEHVRAEPRSGGQSGRVRGPAERREPVKNGEQVRAAGPDAQGQQSPGEAAIDPLGNKRGPGTTKTSIEEGRKMRGPEDQSTAEQGPSW